MPAGEESSPVFRDSGISYLRIPATDPAASARFYAGVFGWTIDADRPDPSFADGTGHVIGHLSAEHRVAGEAGIRPYVYVADVREALRRVAEHGGAVVEPPYAEGDLEVATFRDPAGNMIGIWQRR